ncbi:MAG: hypothetical protein ABIJ00_03300 [Candidatus Eisenbacteria bacterium]
MGNTSSRAETSGAHIYLGMFLIAFATLVFEIVLTRILSVVTWYHLAFFAVSTAMLGMTAGAVTVYLRQEWFSRERLDDSTAKACLGFSLAIPFSLIVLCLTPMHIEGSIMGLYAILLVAFVCMLPFYFSGIAITAVLTRYRLPIGKLYAADLAGASLGCLFVLGALGILDAPGVVIAGGLIGVLAALGFGWMGSSRRTRGLSVCILTVLTFLVVLGAVTPYGMRLAVVKGRVQDFNNILIEEWNSFSRVVVRARSEGRPRILGGSPSAPEDLKLPMYRMSMDGAAGTILGRFASLEDIDYLRYDIANVAYHLRPGGSAYIIGVGAGKDIQSAILFGQERIVGVEINPIFIGLLKGRFREFAGIADRNEVDLVVDEARSHLSRSEDSYSVIQMSMTDTWAATGAGAFSLSENALYTVEAWKICVDHLTDDGIFTVARWYNPRDLGEAGRIVSLAVGTLLESGVTKPSDHIAMVTGRRIATLLMSKRPFEDTDIDALERSCSDMGFQLVIHPRRDPTNLVLKSIVTAASMPELERAISEWPLNYMPPTDDSPYFFNMLRLKHVFASIWLSTEDMPFIDPSRTLVLDAGALRGNLIASRTLSRLILVLILLSVVTIIVPLSLGTQGGRSVVGGRQVLWSGAAYFCLIGAGFMFVEIALIQRLSVFLGHPIYALAILLFTIIASAGAGSMLSERLPLTRRPWVFVYPVMIGLAVTAVRFILPAMASHMVSSPMASRIPATVALLIPLGVLMGFAFPTGMRLVRTAKASQTPWYWALNGVFSVLSSAIAVFVSIYFGISTSLMIGMVCYLALLLCIPGMLTASQQQGTSTSGGGSL